MIALALEEICTGADPINGMLHAYAFERRFDDSPDDVRMRFIEQVSRYIDERARMGTYMEVRERLCDLFDPRPLFSYEHVQARHALRRLAMDAYRARGILDNEVHPHIGRLAGDASTYLFLRVGHTETHRQVDTLRAHLVEHNH